MVFPQSNLPGEAVQWGRALQSAVEQTGSSVETLKQDFLSNNRSLAGQLGVVGRQIEELSLQQQELEAQQNEISTVVNFLASQGSYDQKTTSWLLDRSPVVNPSVVWQTFSSTYDPLITVTAPESGSVRVDLSARFTSVAIAYRADNQPSVVESDTYLGFDVMSSGSTAVSTSDSDSLMLKATASGNGNVDVKTLTLSGFFWVSGLTPGSVYEIRARRGIKGSAVNSPDSNNSQQVFEVARTKMTTTRML